MPEMPWWMWLVMFPALAFVVGNLAARLGIWFWGKYRSTRQPPSKPERLLRAVPDSWQAQHRRSLDRGKLRPTRHRAGGVGQARISQARLDTKREK